MANVETEKTNIVSDAPTRIRRYRERHQSENIKTNETVFVRRRAVFSPKMRWKTAEAMRPPSKPDIGKRFKRPRASEEITNIEDGGILKR